MPAFQEYNAVRHLRRNIAYFRRTRRYWPGWLRWLLLYPFFLPGNLLLWLLKSWILRSRAKAEYKGIRIVDLNFDDTDDQAFIACTLDALRLIEEHAPRHFRRIQREVRYIVNQDLSTGGQYLRVFRQCIVDFPRYQDYSEGSLDPRCREGEDYLWYLAYYAATLVHEATHGHLYSRGMPYLRETRVRIERICHTEEERFVARLPDEDYDFPSLIKPFDETKWNSYWNRTRRQEINLRFARIQKNRIRGRQAANHAARDTATQPIQ
jgi:hypothetical protein